MYTHTLLLLLLKKYENSNKYLCTNRTVFPVIISQNNNQYIMPHDILVIYLSVDYNDHHSWSSI